MADKYSRGIPQPPVIQDGAPPEPPVQDGPPPLQPQPVTQDGLPRPQPLVQDGPPPLPEPLIQDGTPPSQPEPVIQDGTPPPQPKPIVQDGTPPPPPEPIVQDGTPQPQPGPQIQDGQSLQPYGNENQAPVARDDTLSGELGTAQTIRVLENDTDPDGNPLMITQINGIDMQPGWVTWVNGTGLVTLNEDQTLTVELLDGSGKSEFSYTIEDCSGECTTANVIVESNGTDTQTAPPEPLIQDGSPQTIPEPVVQDGTPQPVPVIQDGPPQPVPEQSKNLAPTAKEDAISGELGQAQVVKILENDTDPNGDPLTVTQINGIDMQPGWVTWVNGTGLVTLNEDQTLTVELLDGVGSSQFTYTIEDCSGACSTTTVVVNSTGTETPPENTDNQAPVATDDVVSGVLGTEQTVKILENDTDPNGDPLAVTQINGVDMQPGWVTWVNGTGLVTLNEDQTLTIEWLEGCGVSEFTYTIADCSGTTSTATVILEPEPSKPQPEPIIQDGSPPPQPEPVVQDGSPPPQPEPIIQDGSPQPNPEPVVQDGPPQPNPEPVIQDGSPPPQPEPVIQDGSPPPQPEPVVQGGSPTPKPEPVIQDGSPPPQPEPVVQDGSPPPQPEPILQDGPPPKPEPVVQDGSPTPQPEPVVQDGSPTPQPELVVQDGSPTPQPEPVVQDGPPPPQPEPPSVNCKIIGSDTIREGLNTSNAYRVELEGPVVEDTWVTININSMTAKQTDGAGYKAFNVYYGGGQQTGYNPGTITGEDVIYYTTNQGQQEQVEKVWFNDPIYNSGNTGNAKDNFVGVNNLVHDFLVYDSDGKIVSGNTMKVLVKAGEAISQPFTVKANKEVEVGKKGFAQFSNGAQEGDETFSFSVTKVGDQEACDCDFQITIKDQIASVSPIVLDLNEDGEIGVTGETSSIKKDSDAEVGRTVEFDIDADGEMDTIEWVDGSGDGILTDMSKIAGDGTIDGSALFGDEGGKYSSGYEKLKTHDTDDDGMISGAELEKMGIWIDDGDAILEDGEMISAKDYGIESISTEMQIILDEDGRELMQSTAVTVDGKEILSEDVWFAEADEETIAEMEALESNFDNPPFVEDTI